MHAWHIVPINACPWAASNHMSMSFGCCALQSAHTEPELDEMHRSSVTDDDTKMHSGMSQAP